MALSPRRRESLLFMFLWSAVVEAEAAVILLLLVEDFYPYCMLPAEEGGGSASVPWREFSVSSGASIPVTVGAGGAGGASAIMDKSYALISQGINGQNGGGSSFGSFVSAAGGEGGKIATIVSKYYLTAGLGGAIGGAQGQCNDVLRGGMRTLCAGDEGGQANFMEHYGGNGSGGAGARTISQVSCGQGGDGTTLCGIGLTGVVPAVAGAFPGAGGGGGIISSVFERQMGSGILTADKGANGAGGFVDVSWCDAGYAWVKGSLCQQL